MILLPQDLVRFGDRYLVPGNERYPAQTLMLTATPGPSLRMNFGALAIADPWFPEAAPQQSLIFLGEGEKPTVLTSVTHTRADSGRGEPTRLSDTVGLAEELRLFLAARSDSKRNRVGSFLDYRSFWNTDND